MRGTPDEPSTYNKSARKVNPAKQEYEWRQNPEAPSLRLITYG
jgi:hypothetical protein